MKKLRRINQITNASNEKVLIETKTTNIVANRVFDIINNSLIHCASYEVICFRKAMGSKGEINFSNYEVIIQLSVIKYFFNFLWTFNFEKTAIMVGRPRAN